MGTTWGKYWCLLPLKVRNKLALPGVESSCSRSGAKKSRAWFPSHLSPYSSDEWARMAGSDGLFTARFCTTQGHLYKVHPTGCSQGCCKPGNGHLGEAGGTKPQSTLMCDGNRSRSLKASSVPSAAHACVRLIPTTLRGTWISFQLLL